MIKEETINELAIMRSIMTKRENDACDHLVKESISEMETILHNPEKLEKWRRIGSMLRLKHCEAMRNYIEKLEKALEEVCPDEMAKVNFLWSSFYSLTYVKRSEKSVADLFEATFGVKLF